MKWHGSLKGFGNPRVRRGDALGWKGKEAGAGGNDSITTRAANVNSVHSPSAPEGSSARRKITYRALHLPPFKFSCPNLFSVTAGYLESTVSGLTHPLVPFPSLPLYWPSCQRPRSQLAGREGRSRTIYKTDTLPKENWLHVQCKLRLLYMRKTATCGLFGVQRIHK